LLGVKEQTNILHELSKPKSYWIGHILRIKSLLRQVIGGKIKGEIKVTGRRGRRGRRRRKLLDDLKERRGILTSEGGSSGLQYVESSL
jgi:hypothetical protein